MRLLGATLVAAGCFLLPLAAVGSGRLRGRHQEEKAPYAAWIPPPEYASKTWGHKTMYLANVSIGSDEQTFLMLIDTGSSLSVVPSRACKQPGCLRHHRFDARNSTAANRTASITFAEGTMSGHVFSDFVCAGPSAMHLQEVGFLQATRDPLRSGLRGLAVRRERARKNSVAPKVCAQMAFLVAEQESFDFDDAPFDGILGLGLQGTSDSGFGKGGDRFSIIKQLAKQGYLQDAMFVLRLGNTGKSELLFGDVDETSLVGDRLLWVPLSIEADGQWQIRVSDLTLNGALQNFSPMEVVIDSGTSLLAPDKELARWMQGRLTPEDCDAVNTLPKLGLRLPNGGTLTMLPSDYVDRLDGKCSLAVMPLNVSSSSRRLAPRIILGDSFLRRFTTVFDLGRRRIGFGVARGGDFAQEMAAALFPDLPASRLGDDAPQSSSAEWQSVLTASRGLATHLRVARLTRKKSENSKEFARPNVSDRPASDMILSVNASDMNTTSSVKSSMSYEEQAGYNFVRQLMEAPPPKHHELEHGRSHRKGSLHTKVRPGKNHSAEDNLQAARDKLDIMMTDLKMSNHSYRIIFDNENTTATHPKKDSANSLSWWAGVAAAADVDYELPPRVPTAGPKLTTPSLSPAAEVDADMDLPIAGADDVRKEEFAEDWEAELAREQAEEQARLADSIISRGR